MINYAGNTLIFSEFVSEYLLPYKCELNHSSVLQARRYRSVFHILYCTKLSKAASSIHPHRSNGVTLDVSCADVDYKIQ